MRILHNQSERGGVLVVTILVCALVGIMLVAYLAMVSGQHTFTQRSQVWNNCIPTSESGVEEALAHINHINTTSNFAINGWVLQSGAFRKQRTNQGAIATMAVDTNWPPNITVQGSLRTPVTAGYLTRTVRVKTKLNQRFPNGILSKGVVDMGGTARVDSFNSTNAAESTLGRYDPTKFTDRATVATVSGSLAGMNLGNASVFGAIGTGAGGTYTMGPNGNAGSTAYNDNPAYNGSVETGHYQNDINVYIPDVKLPIPFAPFPLPGAGRVPPVPAGTNYDHVVGDGDFRVFGNFTLGGPTKTMIVTGKARIHVTGTTTLSGTAFILIGNDASLELYAGGTANLAGGGVINSTGNAKNLAIFGLTPTCTSIDYSGGAGYTGTIQAPSADIKISGNADIVGAFVGKSFRIFGNPNIHYDEALKGNPREGRFLVTSWQEL
jgi:hypothetical protein